MTRARRLILAGLAAVSLLSSVAASFAQVPPPVPALPDVERRTSYTISGSTCACSLGSNLNLYGDSTDFQNWVEVWLNGVQVQYNDPVFGWTITSPSNPSLANAARPITDAVLTFNATQTGTVQIVGAMRPRRTTQFNENVGVPARNFNQVLNYVVSSLREFWDKLNDVTGRAILGVPGESFTPLPPAASRAGLYLCFSATGAPTLCSSAGGGGTIAAGTGINFAGTGPTTISTNLSNGLGIATAPSGGAEQISLANMPADTTWCNPTGSTAAPQQCTPAQLAPLTAFVNTFTANHTIATTDCGGTVQMGTGSTGQLTVTLPSVSGFSGACPVTVYNGDSYTAGTSTGKILAGFPAEAFYILFPRQSFHILITNGTWVVDRPAVRWPQPGVQLYTANISHGGSDTANDCLSLTNPCQTINQTISILYTNVDQRNSPPTVFLNAGDSFHECVQSSGQLTGYNFAKITSTSGTGTSGGASWGNVTGSCPGNSLFTIGDGAEWQLSNIYMHNESGTSGIFGVHLHQTGICDCSISGMAYGTFAGGVAIGSDNNSMINMAASYTIIAGGANPTPTFFGIGSGTTLNECGACTTTFSGSPNITTMYAINGGGATINFGPSHAYAGPVTIANQCSVTGPSLISVSGNAIPGTATCAAGASHGGVVF
jgi:hypothetical protein